MAGSCFSIKEVYQLEAASVSAFPITPDIIPGLLGRKGTRPASEEALGARHLC